MNENDWSHNTDVLTSSENDLTVAFMSEVF